MCPIRVFPIENGKIALVRARVVTYYIKLFRSGADRHNGFLISLLLLVVETIRNIFHYLCKTSSCQKYFQIWKWIDQQILFLRSCFYKYKVKKKFLCLLLVSGQWFFDIAMYFPSYTAKLFLYVYRIYYFKLPLSK